MLVPEHWVPLYHPATCLFCILLNGFSNTWHICNCVFNPSLPLLDHKFHEDQDSVFLAHHPFLPPKESVQVPRTHVMMQRLLNWSEGAFEMGVKWQWYSELGVKRIVFHSKITTHTYVELNVRLITSRNGKSWIREVTSIKIEYMASGARQSGVESWRAVCSVSSGPTCPHL